MKRNNARSLLGLDNDITADNDTYNSSTIQTEQLISQHNDEHLDRLGDKVKAIKNVAIIIDGQVADSNKLLNDMDTEMGNVSGLLGHTVTKLKTLAKSGGGWHMCYLVLFMLFVFIVIYFLVGSKSDSPPSSSSPSNEP